MLGKATAARARPTATNPLLVGLVVDVSGSMTSSIRNDSGPIRNRLDSLRESLDELIAKGAKLCTEGIGGDVSPRLRLFAYGFGFGNPLSFLLGDDGPSVRDLLDLGNSSEGAIGIDQLAQDWHMYRSHIGSLVPKMFGDTPMAQAFRAAKNRIDIELSSVAYTRPPILFILSDGEPTDESHSNVRALARELKDDGVIIISCLLTAGDITEPRRLYGRDRPEWPDGAQLMYDCASPLPDDSPLNAYLIENRWITEPGSKLFTQINQSEVLDEFSRIVLSPLIPREARLATPVPPVRVFVTYSHQDARYLQDGSLLGYLSALRNEGVEFFTDRDISTGDLWHARIKQAIEQTDVVLALVSQAFLNSDYCQNIEISAFLEARRRLGTVILPVILSPCDWKSHEWLAQTQARPRGGRTLEGDFRGRGKRDEIFLSILEDLREAARTVR